MRFPQSISGVIFIPTFSVGVARAPLEKPPGEDVGREAEVFLPKPHAG
jgi:hypothetical protein